MAMSDVVEQVSHTPGPWLVRGTDVYGAGVKVASAPSMRQTAGSTVGHEQATANARLVAASPELVASLREMVDLYTELVNSGDAGFWDPETEKQVQRARAAIAKAEAR